MYSSSRSSRTSYANNNNNNLARDSYIHNNFVKTIGGIFGFICISSGVLYQLYEEYKTEPRSVNIIEKKTVQEQNAAADLNKALEEKKNAKTDEEIAHDAKLKAEKDAAEQENYYDRIEGKPRKSEAAAAAEVAAEVADAAKAKTIAADAAVEVAKTAAEVAKTAAAVAAKSKAEEEAREALAKAENATKALALVATAIKEAENAKNNEQIKKEQTKKKENYSPTSYPHDLKPLKTNAKQALPLEEEKKYTDNFSNENETKKTIAVQKEAILKRILNALSPNISPSYDNNKKITGGAISDDKKIIQDLIEYLKSEDVTKIMETRSMNDPEKQKKMENIRSIELETLKKQISHAHIDYEIDQVYDLFFPKALESGDMKPTPAPNEKVYETKEELITSMYSYPIDPDDLDKGDDKSKQENNPFGFDSNVQRSNASAWDETMGVELFLLFLKHSGSTDKTSYFGKDGYYDKPMFTNKTTTTRKTPNFLHSGNEL